MGKPIRHALGLALGIWVLVALANSAGGQASRMPSPGSGRKPNHYMGPFGQVEPGARPVEPATPQPPSPPSPTPSAENPAAGGAGSATGARAGATRSGGIGRRPRSTATGTLTPHWETWWEWNKERYLGLGRRSRPAGPETGRGPVFMGRPIGGRLSEREAFRRLQRVTVLPALRREAARGTTMLRLAAVYALGFTGEREVLPDLAAALADGSLEVREAALAALGMSGQPEAASVLTEVLRGRRPGTGDQTLCQAADRERGLAALGLGLIGAAGPIEILGKTAFQRATSRELRGACLLALGLIRDAEARKWLARATKARWCGVTERALIATALGYQGDEEVLGALYRLLRDDAAEVRRAAVLAVGSFPRQEILRRNLEETRSRLATEGLSENGRQRLADHAAELHASIVRAREAEAETWSRLRHVLRQLMLRDADQAVRAFATIALGQVGEMSDAEALGRQLADAGLEIRGFAALALGLLVRAHRAEGDAVLAELRRRLEAAKEPGLRGALCISLGLGGDRRAGPPMRAALDRGSPPSLRGHAGTALGLLGDPVHASAVARSLATALDIVEIQNSALGLSRIGGRNEVAFLKSVLETSHDTHEQIAAASGLAFLGGEAALSSLARFLDAEGKPSAARAFVAEGLGLALDFADPTALARVTAGYDFLLRLGPVDRVADLKW